MTGNNSYKVIIKSNKKDFMNTATQEEIKIMGAFRLFERIAF